MLTWLLKNGGRDQILPRFDHVQVWLKDHPNDTYVRTQFLAFLGELPAAYDKDRKQAVVDYSAWLKDHPNDTCVRTQFLAFLGGLAERLSDLKANGADFVGEWITTHVSTWLWSTPHSHHKMELLEATLYLVASSASAAEVKRVMVEATRMITNAKGAREVGALVNAVPSLYHRLFWEMDHSPSSRQETVGALANAKAAIEKWIDQNPDSGLGFPWLP